MHKMEFSHFTFIDIKIVDVAIVNKKNPEAF